MAQHTHYFFAIRLPLEIKHALKDYVDTIVDDFPFSRWVHEQDYHITLAFLGNAEGEKLEEARERVRKEVSTSAPFHLKINTLGIFGRKNSPRIFWAGVQTEEKLHKVRDQVYSACIGAGFHLETRPFSPHITLARKWPEDRPFPIEPFEQMKMFQAPLEFKADEIVLYQTHLDRTPKYEAISLFTLNHS